MVVLASVVKVTVMATYNLNMTDQGVVLSPVFSRCLVQM